MYSPIVMSLLEKFKNKTPRTDTGYQSNGSASNTKMHSGLKSISSTLALLVAAPLLALFLTAHVFQPYEVDGRSMETTLQHSDRLIVFKLPKTMANLFRGDYQPNRWDIVVFDKPRRLSAPESTKHLIKRVIGLPGERVTIKDGLVTIYNKDLPEGFNPDLGQEYYKSISSTSGNVDITVGQKEIFVLGDNRSNSSDSRVFGSIPDSIIVGRATARFIPIDTMQRF